MAVFKNDEQGRLVIPLKEGEEIVVTTPQGDRIAIMAGFTERVFFTCRNDDRERHIYKVGDDKNVEFAAIINA